MTIFEAAAELNAGVRALQALAKRHSIGALEIGPNSKVRRIFTASDLEALRARLGNRGRPRKS